MPSSSVDARVKIGLFYPTAIKILTSNASRSKFGSKDYTPFVKWDTCTDLSYRCAVSTFCCVVFLVSAKIVLLASDLSWHSDALYLWFGGNIQCSDRVCSADGFSVHSTITDTSETGSSAFLFIPQDLLMLCGDIESNPGPRHSSMRQTRLTSSSASATAPSPAPPVEPTAEPSMQVVADLLGSVHSSLREMREENRQASWLLEKAKSPIPTTAPSNDPPPSTEEPATGDVMSVLHKLNSKLDEMKANITQLTTMCSDFQKEMLAMHDKVGYLENENKEIKKENCELRGRLETLEEKTDRLESKMTRNNLIFFGVDRKEKESRIDCERVVRNVLCEKLQLSDEIRFDNAHRINKNADSPIVVSFSDFHQKKTVLMAKQKLKGTNIFINEDFSPRVRVVRKKLMPFLKDAKKSGKKVALVYDHLIINGDKMFLGNDGLLKS